MKNLKFLIGFLVVIGSFFVVSATNFNTDRPTLSISEDQEAQFPGGKEKMNEWIKENLRTPKNNRRYGIVRVEFVVKKNGKCSNFTIKKGLNEDMDFAAIECLQGMPMWEPAIQNGKKVNSTVIIPIKFGEE